MMGVKIIPCASYSFPDLQPVGGNISIACCHRYTDIKLDQKGGLFSSRVEVIVFRRVIAVPQMLNEPADTHPFVQISYK